MFTFFDGNSGCQHHYPLPLHPNQASHPRTNNPDPLPLPHSLAFATISDALRKELVVKAEEQKSVFGELDRDDYLDAGRRRAGAEALNEPQQLHGLSVRTRATTATY